ncbi:hypothetical protein PAXINDRAFT_78350, partial [Paxillus involutus ATCC 200175]
TGQTLGAASQYSSGLAISQFPADGLMGMAFQSISDYNASPVFQTLVSEGQTDQSVFAFKLESYQNHEISYCILESMQSEIGGQAEGTHALVEATWDLSASRLTLLSGLVSPERLEMAIGVPNFCLGG